jgi:two-component sensor histidine kinase
MTDDRCISFQEDLTTTAGELTFLATKGPLHDAAGKVIGMFGISRDITERRRMEVVLRDSLEEKEALLKEVHHRVKNNLQIVASLLSLQASRTPNREVVDVLRDTRNRVRSMALLHDMLCRSGNLARINFADYVRELCVQLQRSSGPANAGVRVESQVTFLGLTLEQAMPCGLIISELVSNSLKHGFPEDRRGRVMVELQTADEQHLVLCVRDDGIGLPSGFDLTGATSLGLKLVSNLVGQLGGQLVVERPPDGGAAFRVVFQVPQVPKNTPL